MASWRVDNLGSVRTNKFVISLATKTTGERFQGVNNWEARALGLTE